MQVVTQAFKDHNLVAAPRLGVWRVEYKRRIIPSFTLEASPKIVTADDIVAINAIAENAIWSRASSSRCSQPMIWSSDRRNR